MTDDLLPTIAFAFAMVGFSSLSSGPLDPYILAICFSVRHRHALPRLAPAWLEGFAASIVASPALKPTLCIFAIAFFAFPVLWRIFAKAEGPRWDGPGKVLIFPSRTTHMRLFPKKHHFSYSYLVVGIPVGWEGSIGGLFSVGVEASWSTSSWFVPSSWFQKGWFTVDARDFFERGHTSTGLRGKLDGYLKTQVWTQLHLPFCRSLMTSGGGSVRVPARLPGNGSSLSWLPVQPRLFLVSVRRGQDAGRCDIGGQ